MTQRDGYIRVNLIMCVVFIPFLFLKIPLIGYILLFLFLFVLVAIPVTGVWAEDSKLESSSNFRIIRKDNMYYIQQESWFPFFWNLIDRPYLNMEEALTDVHDFIDKSKEVVVWRNRRKR